MDGDEEEDVELVVGEMNTRKFSGKLFFQLTGEGEDERLALEEKSVEYNAVRNRLMYESRENVRRLAQLLNLRRARDGEI